MRRVGRLSRRQRWTLARVGVLLGAIRIGLRVLPFAWLRRRLDDLVVPRPIGRAEAAAYRRRVVWAVRVAGPYVLGERPCLAQALALQWLLRRRAIESVLRIGVARAADGGLLAHAWLETEGAVLIGGPDAAEKYAMLAEDSSGQPPVVPSLRRRIHTRTPGGEGTEERE